LLVSVLVVTYNSGKFITETLDSVRLQTYSDLELIISDDCSGDNTVEICRSWLKIHGNRFVRTEVLTVNANSGVAANCNRGLRSASGEWIKFCAGDDCLKPGCVEDNISWISTHQEVRALFSLVEVYRETFEPVSYIKTIPGDPYNHEGIMAPGRTAESQYNMLLITDRINFTPSFFIHRETLLEVGGFDERFRLLEDHPLWLNLTRGGHRLFMMDKPTVMYRQHSAAIENILTGYLVRPNYFLTERFRRVYTYPNMPADIRLHERFTWYASQVFRCKWLNKNNKANRILLSLLTIYMNPFRYYIYFKKRFNRNLTGNEFYV